MLERIVTSASNPLVKKAVAVRMSRHRGTDGPFLAEGPHVIEMALNADSNIHEVFLTKDFAGSVDGGKIVQRLSSNKYQPQIILLPDRLLSKICDTGTPQGIAAIVSLVTAGFKDLQMQNLPLIAACDGIQDPGNLGTIIRVSDAIGADAVIVLPETCDPLSPKVVRSTAGSIFNIPVISMGHSEFSDYMSSKGIGIVIADIRAEKTVYDSNLRKPVALVFGNEARGVSRPIQLQAAEAIKLPMPGKAESLNAAVAAAVCLYEAFRQRNQPS